MASVLQDLRCRRCGNAIFGPMCPGHSIVGLWCGHPDAGGRYPKRDREDEAATPRFVGRSSGGESGPFADDPPQWCPIAEQGKDGE